MLNLYKYLYYRLYKWNLKTWGKSDGAEFNASLGIAMLIGAHLSIILIIIDIVYPVFFNNQEFLSGFPKILLMGIMGVLIIISYFWFVYKKRYLKIVEKYKDETNKQKLVRGLFLFLFIILTIGIILLLAYIGKNCRIIN